MRAGGMCAGSSRANQKERERGRETERESVEEGHPREIGTAVCCFLGKMRVRKERKQKKGEKN